LKNPQFVLAIFFKALSFLILTLIRVSIILVLVGIEYLLCFYYGSRVFYI